MIPETRFTIQDNPLYLSAVDEYLKDGIEYTSNTISKADKGDIEQLAMDSFCEGAQFILDATNDGKITIATMVH